MASSSASYNTRYCCTVAVRVYSILLIEANTGILLYEFSYEYIYDEGGNFVLRGVVGYVVRRPTRRSRVGVVNTQTS